MTDWRAEARAAAQRHGINPAIFVRQIGAESNFNPNARSSAGARGIAQFMPATAAGLGINPDDPRQALDGAAKLMASYLKKYGSWQDSLAAYNGGPGVVGRALPGETRAYISKILGGTRPSATVTPRSAEPPRSAAATVERPPTTKVDTSSAIVDSLLAQKPLSQRKLGGGGLLAATNARIATGAYTTTTPGSTTTTEPKAVKTSAGKVASAAQAPTAKGTANFEGRVVAAWIAPILRYARSQGWKGQVTSGFRTLADQTRIYNSGVRPAAKPGTSNHENPNFPGGAVDVSDAQGLSNILKGSKYASLLVWAGAKDPPHFSRPHNGSY